MEKNEQVARGRFGSGIHLAGPASGGGDHPGSAGKSDLHRSIPATAIHYDSLGIGGILSTRQAPGDVFFLIQRWDDDGN